MEIVTQEKTSRQYNSFYPGTLDGAYGWMIPGPNGTVTVNPLVKPSMGRARWRERTLTTMAGCG